MATVKRKINDELDEIEIGRAEQPDAPAPAGHPVALYEPAPASPLDLPAEVFRAGLDRRKANRGALMEWIRSALVEGTDFGRIHTAGKQKCQLAAHSAAHACKDPRHWSKPSLWKPGAEKICGMLGVTVHYPNLAAYEQAALSGASLAAIILRCELHDGQGRTVAEGIGARNVQQDYGDLNKALKMAGKSAHIDATLRMAGLSEVFTQDIEDMAAPTGSPAPEARPAETTEPEAPPPPPERIGAEDIRTIERHAVAYGLDVERVTAWIGKACHCSIGELTRTQYGKVLEKLALLAYEAGVTPEALAERAEKTRKLAREAADGAQYADDHAAYRREMDTAARLGADARYLDGLADGMKAVIEARGMEA
jgi:hypothetical protein